MKAPPKAVIFDVDGTLIDSVDVNAKAWQEAFRKFGHEFAFSKIRAQIGKGGDQLMPVFLSKKRIEKKGEEIEKYRGELFKSKYLPKVKAFPKVRELFECLLDDGWKLALASSAKEEDLQTYKKICRIDDLLKAETSSDDANKSKPHPDIFQAAMKKLGKIPPSRCIVVGDSPYDAQAAKKAKIRSVGFLCGGFSQKLLLKAGCKAIYRDPGHLLKSFEEWVLAE